MWARFERLAARGDVVLAASWIAINLKDVAESVEMLKDAKKKRSERTRLNQVCRSLDAYRASLIARINSLFPHRKFPVPSCRESARKVLKNRR